MADLTYEDLRETQRRIRSGETTIDVEARRYRLRELAAALRMTRGMLQAIAMGWSDEQLNTRPPEAGPADASADRWSASEALTHVIATQNWYLLHMTRLLGRREHFDVMVHGLGDLARQGVPGAQLAAELRDATARLLAEIDAIPAAADLDATRDSTYFGDLSLRGWVMLAIQHDVEHFDQIQRVARQAGFPAKE
jgi:uncharacterized damage-inducible protein DinB